MLVHIIRSGSDSTEGGNEAFKLLGVRVLWVHEYFKEVLGREGGSL
jgi:hypothetical protein